jgi:hypothetical protein
MDTAAANNCVAVFDRHTDAEAAIRELQRVGFDMKKLSIVGRDYHTEEHAVGFYNGGPRAALGQAGERSGAASSASCSRPRSSSSQASGRS